MKILQDRLISFVSNLIIIVFLVVFISPLIVTLSMSFRSPDDSASPFALFKSFKLDSYSLAFRKLDYIRAISNSVVITFVSVLSIVIIASMAAYPLARIKSKTCRILTLFFLAGIMVSAQIAIVPIYQVFKFIGLSHSRLAPILMYVSGSMPFCIFIYTGFIGASIPLSLEEAAVIDGAGLFRRFWTVVFPLVKPATITIIITQGVSIWNDFFMPMLFLTQQRQKPLTLVMLGFMGDAYSPTQWNTLFAACFLSTLPLLILYSFFQRHLVGGITVGSVKG